MSRPAARTRKSPVFTRKLRAEAAAGAFPILDQLRERHADVADFDTVVDALVRARVSGWKDALRVTATFDPERSATWVSRADLLYKLRRMIRAARS